MAKWLHPLPSWGLRTLSTRTTSEMVDSTVPSRLSVCRLGSLCRPMRRGQQFFVHQELCCGSAMSISYAINCLGRAPFPWTCVRVTTPPPESRPRCLAYVLASARPWNAMPSARETTRHTHDLHAHKGFCSCPQCLTHLVLGLCCLFVKVRLC